MTIMNLHFAGTRLYTATKFEEEAGRIGVARALPAFALRNLAYGDVIVLATFKPNPRVIEDEPQDPMPFVKTTYPRIGSADAWGYFVVNGVNLNAPPEVYAALLDMLHVVRSEERHERVERECGAYEVVSISYVTESIREIVDRGEALAVKFGVKVKWFVTGTEFRPLAPHVDIDPVTFTRTIVKVELDGWSPFVTPPSVEEDGKPLAFLGDYTSRKYRLMTDDERAAANRRRIEAANRGRLRRMHRKFDHIDDTGAAT